MKYKDIAHTYAVALMQLGEEHKIDVVKELSDVMAVIKNSSNLENLFFLESFTKEEKISVFSKIAEKIATSKILENCTLFLFSEKRIIFLPFILERIKALDDAKKNLVRGVLEGSEDNVSDNTMGKIKHFLQNKLGKHTELTYKKTKAVTAGYRTIIGDFMLDISFEGQLYNFKHSVKE